MLTTDMKQSTIIFTMMRMWKQRSDCLQMLIKNWMNAESFLDCLILVEL
jgi:hypothetical protein